MGGVDRNPRVDSVQLLGRLAARLTIAMAAMIIGLAGGVGQARAQNIDWLVSVEDTGFDPVGVGGAVDYLLSIDNNGFDPAPAESAGGQPP